MREKLKALLFQLSACREGRSARPASRDLLEIGIFDLQRHAVGPLLLFRAHLGRPTDHSRFSKADVHPKGVHGYDGWQADLGAIDSACDSAISTASNWDLHESPEAEADEERETGRAHADQ